MDVDDSTVVVLQQQGQGEVNTLQGLLQPAAAAAASSSPASDSSSSSSSLMALAGHRSQARREWLLRHVVMPAVKYVYRPPKARARDGSVLLLTSMEKLYRVFERCGW
jgi:hypothetical protein